MKKSYLFLLAFLVTFSFPAFSQALKPIRINLATIANGASGVGLGAEYIFPLEKMSLGTELLITIPWNIGAFVRLYPFSSLGAGLSFGIEYQYHFEIQQAGTQGKSAWHEFGAGLGWQWIVGDRMDIGLGVSCDYIMFQNPAFASNHLLFPTNIHMGILLK